MVINNSVIVATGALLLSSTGAVAQVERAPAAVAEQSEMGSEAAPWPLLIVGIAALAALIYLLVDDDSQAVSA